jgi:hypothetical protein
MVIGSQVSFDGYVLQASAAEVKSQMKILRFPNKTFS